MLYGVDGPSIQRSLTVPDDVYQVNPSMFISEFMVARVASESISPDGNINVPFMENLGARLATASERLENVKKVNIIRNVNNTDNSNLITSLTSPLGSSFYASDHKTILVANDIGDTLMTDNVVFGKSIFVTFSSYTSSYTNTNVSPPTCVTSYSLPQSDTFIHREVSLLSGLETVPPGLLDNYSSREIPRSVDDPRIILNSGDFGNFTWFRRESTSTD
jgi:hypothetical protein